MEEKKKEDYITSIENIVQTRPAVAGPVYNMLRLDLMAVNHVSASLTFNIHSLAVLHQRNGIRAIEKLGI